MKKIEFDSSALFDKALQLYFPHKDSQNLNSQSWDQLQQWTADSSGLSSYREGVRKAWGLQESQWIAERLRKRFQRMIVLGIGGSALGARAGLSALAWSIPKGSERKLVIIDNLDPLWMHQELQRDLSDTVFAVISKSGGTVETVSQLSEVLRVLGQSSLKAQDHIVVVTDPESGALRQWTNENKIPSLDLDPRLGGRFSVLSPVGYLPLAFAGLDVAALHSGARFFFEESAHWLVPLAERLVELESQGVRAINLLSYSSALREMGAWFVQLWGESLGKKRSAVQSTGMLPISSVGATDQHSLLQYLLDGPNQVVTGVVTIASWPSLGPNEPHVAKVPPEFSKQSFLAGHRFSEILSAEAEATFEALKLSERPVFRMIWPELSAQTVGQWFAAWMDLTVLCAARLQVNPFDQPGVERIKLRIPAALTRSQESAL
jgi:glucose-6-phosphate isomerase